MKKTLLLFALFFTTISFSQFILDNTYFYTRGVQRIVLENSGEKYYYVNWQTGNIQFYNADHSPWKSVMLPLPSQNWTLGITHISETKINADNNLEIVYSTYSSPNIRQCKIVNELGTVLLSVENCQSLRLDEKEGVTDKIISSTGVVYAVPGLTAEHIYPIVNYANVKRIKLENSGEKYYVLDIANSLVALYNADHTFWKNITLPKPDGYSITGLDLLSENELNADNLIEVGYQCSNNSQGESRIVNENGELLLIATNPGQFQVSALDGMPNKLMVYYLTGDLPDETSRRTDVYSVPGFNLEHTYQQTVFRVKLEISGDKYHAYDYDYLTSDITIFNNDHTLWKTIETSAQPGETIENVFITEKKIDADNALELMYTIATNTLDGGHYRGYVIKDNGTVLLDLPGAYDMKLSELPNLATKLIVHSQDGPSFDQLYYTTTVYRLDEAFATTEFDKSSISIAPIPAQTTINLLSKSSIVEASLFDIRGVAMNQSKGTDIKNINVENLASGIYLLHLTSIDGEISVRKIVISH